jgi:hypothetical protein
MKVIMADSLINPKDKENCQLTQTKLLFVHRTSQIRSSLLQDSDMDYTEEGVHCTLILLFILFIFGTRSSDI